MIDIIICEDNKQQRKIIENVVINVIAELNYNFRIRLSVDNSEDVIRFAMENNRPSVYLLDIQLNNEEDGIELAKSIRNYDPDGYIIFITSHSELAFLTFQYKVHAFDYIIKGELESLKSRIRESLMNVSKENKNRAIEQKDKRFISLTVGNNIRNFDLDKILFFETTRVPHKLRLHTDCGQYDFYGEIKNIEENVTEDYYRVHRAFLVNTNKIKSINKADNSILMINDEVCYASSKYIKGLIKKCAI